METMRGREWPWFSALSWWKKVALAIAFAILCLAFVLLPQGVSADLFASAALAALTVPLLPLARRWWVGLFVLLTVAIMSILLATARMAPYGVVIVAAIAFLLAVVQGWQSAATHPGRKR